MPEAYALSVVQSHVSDVWGLNTKGWRLTDVALIEVFGPVGDKGVADDEDIEFGDEFALVFGIAGVIPVIPLAACAINVFLCH